MLTDYAFFLATYAAFAVTGGLVYLFFDSTGG